eukprot:80222_1
MRMDYGDGNGDEEMCDTYPGKACNQYYDKSGALWVYYPFNDYCCLGCPAGQYCTVIKPNWIANGTYLGKQQINNRICDVWTEFGDNLGLLGRKNTERVCGIIMMDLG